MKKRDGILILALLILAASIWLAFSYLSPGGGETVRITVNDQVYGEYSLEENQEISIGKTNICEIKDGKVRMIWADCPDQLCVHQKALDERGRGTIICLPNKVVIEVVGQRIQSAEDGLDAVAG